MLQQTQVQTVIPYFNRFITRFPTNNALAEAAIDDVLSLWTGLGYYRRARSLHQAAKLIQAEYGGNLPDTLEQLTELPGIGRSTAGAVLASGFDKPGVILDGNVKRVLARFHALEGEIGKAATLRRAWELAEIHSPKTACADYAQAIMDLGALCCRKQAPSCTECPVAERCLAKQQNRVADFPQKGKRRKPRSEQLNLLLVVDTHGSFLLEQQAKEGLWGNLWLPLRLAVRTSDKDLLTQFDIERSEVESIETLPVFTHTLSHVKFQVATKVVLIERASVPESLPIHQKWFSVDELQSIGLARLTTSILNRWQQCKAVA